MRIKIGAILAAALLSVSLAACGKSKKPIVVGSKNDTEQALLAEIVAQHLEHRTNGPVERRLRFGNTEILYQALIVGDVSIYPEYTGIINTVILKEQPPADPAIVLERARLEMARLAQAELFGPLGFENPPAIVVQASAAERISTLSDAEGGKPRWKLGISYDFQQRNDGLRALHEYRIPMAGPIRSMDAKDLFPTLMKGDVTMIATSLTDGRLTLPEWKVLKDDRQVFPPQQGVLLARQDLLMSDPRIRPALAELTGKFNQETMRKLNARVDVDKQTVERVATDFLASAGLK